MEIRHKVGKTTDNSTDVKQQYTNTFQACIWKLIAKC